jgi:hypothetical protein
MDEQGPMTSTNEAHNQVFVINFLLDIGIGWLTG